MNTRTKSLFGYIFPALGGLFVTYLYNVVDGIFVGQGIGSAALGAVNIGVPFITFVVAIAAMFPMGGAVANIFLDWLFIFPLQMGVIGAAIASGLGQVCSVLVLLSHFLRKKGDLRIKAFQIDFSLIKKNLQAWCTGGGYTAHNAHYGTLL